jgi:virginiamycin B lyase
MRVLLLALSLSLSFGASASAQADAPGTITEFHLAWPSPKTNSTHELTYDRKAGDVLWASGQEQDHLARVALDGTVQYVAMPKGSGPHGLDFDAEGRLWVSLEFADLVVRLDKDGHIAQQIDVAIHPAGAQHPLRTSPHGIAFAADGRTIWFTGKQSGTIGRIAPDGSVAHFSLPTVGAMPIYLASGPDGHMWCTELVGNKIARIKPDGTIDEFAIPTPNSRPIAIVPAPDGRSMWFSEEAGNKVARIDFTGKITEFHVPMTEPHVILAGLSFDRDGNL